MTKKAIIDLMKTAKSASIGFRGLSTNDEVDKARQAIRDQWAVSIAKHKTDNPDDPTIQNAVMTEKDNKLSYITNIYFLPSYPRTGSIVVKSAEYCIDGVYGKFVDIVKESFDPENNSFKTKADSIITIY